MRHHMTANGPIPFTSEEEAEWDAMEAAAIAKSEADKIVQRRQEILASLASIDLKSIRALREGYQPKIDELDAQAATLRAEMAAL